MTLIKQGTARTLTIGPILDIDGAQKTDEVVANIRLSKDTGDPAAPDATPGAASTLTHKHTGKYELALTAIDTNTVGVLQISLNSGTNEMPVQSFNVVPANVYDSLVAGTDKLDVASVEFTADALVQAIGAGQMSPSFSYDTSGTAWQALAWWTQWATTYLRALVRKDTDFGNRSPVLATLNTNSIGGVTGTYDNTTDSLEAQRDNVGAAGASLTALGDTRVANLDASVSAAKTAADNAKTAADTAASAAGTAATNAGAAATAAGNALTAIGDVPTNTEFELRTLPSASYATAASVAALPAAVWSVTTRTLSSFGTLVADVATAVWSATTRRLTGTSGGTGPTSQTNAVDIRHQAFKNGTEVLSARVRRHNGDDLVQADVSAIVYSVYLLDRDDPDSRTAVTGHAAVTLDKTAVVFNTLQTDELAADWNFRHVLDVSANQAFAIAGRDYLVEYRITQAAAGTQVIVVRFRVTVV